MEIRKHTVDFRISIFFVKLNKYNSYSLKIRKNKNVGWQCLSKVTGIILYTRSVYY